MDRARTGRRLAAVLRLADVVAAASAAGSFQPQSLPAHLVGRMVGRIGRLQGSGMARMAKVVPQGGLAKNEVRQRAARALLTGAWEGAKGWRNLGGQIGAEYGGEIAGWSARRHGKRGMAEAEARIAGIKRGRAIGKDVATIAMAGTGGYGAGVLRDKFNEGGGWPKVKQSLRQGWSDTRAVFSGDAFTAAGQRRIRERERREGLRKSWGVALSAASLALPLVTETQTGQRAMRWTGRKIGSAWRAMGGTKRTAAKVRHGARAAGTAIGSQRATLSSGAAAGGTYLMTRDHYRNRDREA
jgi:hypothetical protein